MKSDTTLEFVLKRDRLIVIAGLSAVVLVAVAYTVAGIGMNMSAVTMTQMALTMPEMVMMPAVWSPSYALLIFFMWWIMMVAMMIPSAAPAILLYSAAARRRKSERTPYTATVMFTLGYLAVWAAFSAAVVAAQWGLERVGVLTGMMQIGSGSVAGVVLILAGLYQLTPLKQACLRHCQNPLLFLIHHWRAGHRGALRMGSEHGVFCLGCCWFLMALLFVGGIMNLIWIAGLALYVAFEKLASNRPWLMNATGWILVSAGIFLLARPQLAA
jgi:predicted metal-binding membrane protein